MEHGLELIIARLEILGIGVCNIIHNPGNIGNLSFSVFLDAWKYWKSGFSDCLVSWKYGRRAGGSRGCVVLPWIIFGTCFLEFLDILEILEI